MSQMSYALSSDPDILSNDLQKYAIEKHLCKACVKMPVQTS